MGQKAKCCEGSQSETLVIYMSVWHVSLITDSRQIMHSGNEGTRDAHSMLLSRVSGARAIADLVRVICTQDIGSDSLIGARIRE